jgi:hypothetical protein
MLTKVDKDTLAKALVVAWSKYTHAFGQPPHGTYKQLRAMLEFCPNIGFDVEKD